MIKFDLIKYQQKQLKMQYQYYLPKIKKNRDRSYFVSSSQNQIDLSNMIQKGQYKNFRNQRNLSNVDHYLGFQKESPFNKKIQKNLDEQYSLLFNNKVYLQQIRDLNNPRQQTKKNYKIIQENQDQQKDNEITQKQIQLDYKSLLKSKIQNTISILPQLHWKPQTRYNPAICVYKDQLYSFGGLGHQDLTSFDFEKRKWKFQKNLNIDSRYGHTMFVKDDKFYIFGGKTKDGLDNYLYIFDTDGKIEEVNFPCEKRYRHMCFWLDQKVIVMGGKNHYGHWINDINIYDFQNFTRIQGSGKMRGAEAQNIDGQIWTFGLDGLYQTSHMAVDRWDWIKPVCKGNCPEPRQQHAMCFNEDKNLLCIMGGRSGSTILNDFFALNIQNYNWMKIIHKGQNIGKRCLHKMVVYSQKLYILGGYNFEGYLNYDLIQIKQGIKINQIISKLITKTSMQFFKVFDLQFVQIFQNQFKYKSIRSHYFD